MIHQRKPRSLNPVAVAVASVRCASSMIHSLLLLCGSLRLRGDSFSRGDSPQRPQRLRRENRDHELPCQKVGRTPNCILRIEPAEVITPKLADVAPAAGTELPGCP